MRKLMLVLVAAVAFTPAVASTEHDQQVAEIRRLANELFPATSQTQRRQQWVADQLSDLLRAERGQPPHDYQPQTTPQATQVCNSWMWLARQFICTGWIWR
jgi:hypothetical protein